MPQLPLTEADSGMDMRQDASRRNFKGTFEKGREHDRSDFIGGGPARRFGQEQLLGDAGGAPLYRRAFEAARQAADA